MIIIQKEYAQKCASNPINGIASIPDYELLVLRRHNEQMENYYYGQWWSIWVTQILEY